MGVIKGVLKEELENSIQMKSDYERELSKLPKGSLKVLKRLDKAGVLKDVILIGSWCIPSDLVVEFLSPEKGKAQTNQSSYQN